MKMNEGKNPIIAQDSEAFPFGTHYFFQSPLAKKQFTNVKGVGIWGGGKSKEWIALFNKDEGEKWTGLLGQMKDLSIDTSVSTNQIALRIHMQPGQLFEIAYSKEQLGNVERMGIFIDNLKDFVVSKGYEFKAIPTTKFLPEPIEETEKTIVFEGLITKIENNIAFITLADDSGNESFMEISIEDLKKDSIDSRIGVIFYFILKQKGDWEKVELAQIKRTKLTTKEFDSLYKYYEDEYRGV